MQYELKENQLNAEDFMRLWGTTDWRDLSEPQVDAALKNSLITICAVHNNQVIGMGRLIGDGAIACFINDVIVCPEYQGLGIGKAIIERLIEHVKANGFADTQVAIGLFSAKDKEGFYQQLGFDKRPNESRGAGMVRKIEINLCRYRSLQSMSG